MPPRNHKRTQTPVVVPDFSGAQDTTPIGLSVPDGIPTGNADVVTAINPVLAAPTPAPTTETAAAKIPDASTIPKTVLPVRPLQTAAKRENYDAEVNYEKDMAFLMKLLVELMNGNFKNAGNDFDEYFKENPKIVNSPFLFEVMAKTIGNHHNYIEHILARVDKASDYSFQNEMYEIMKWCDSRKFAIGNAANIFIDRMCHLDFLSEIVTEREGPSRRHMTHQADTMEFLDSDATNQILDLLVSKINPNKDIDINILKKIYNYTPYLCEILMRHGFNITTLIDGLPFPYYAMRSATKIVYDKKELEKNLATEKSANVPEWSISHGQKFLSALKNSKDFKLEPYYFVGCCDVKLMNILCKDAYFCSKIIHPMPQEEPFCGKYLIQTVEEFPQVVDILTRFGSPKPNADEWDIAAIRNPQLMKHVLNERRPDMSKLNSRGWASIGYAAYYGNRSRTHWEVLKQMYTYDSKCLNYLSLPDVYNWSVLHIICRKFNIGLWRASYDSGKISKNEEQITDLANLPTDNDIYQTEILDWAYSRCPVTSDELGRTPLMCMPITSLSWEMCEPLMNRYADKEAKFLNISVSAFLKSLMQLRADESKNIEKDTEDRKNVINTGTLQKYYPMINPKKKF